MTDFEDREGAPDGGETWQVGGALFGRLLSLLGSSICVIMRALGKGDMMASTEAQKRASAKYQRLNTKQVNLKFSPNEMELYDWIQSREGAASTYIKALIRADMERNKLD